MDKTVKVQLPQEGLCMAQAQRKKCILPTMSEFSDLLESDQPIATASDRSYCVYHVYSRTC